jgi:hypothetical protein
MSNQFITVTGWNTRRKFRINVNNIERYNISSDKQHTIILTTSNTITEVSETPEEIDMLINLDCDPD